MASSQAASYRSASLGRQVGAVIATKDGSVLSTGTNEVPKVGGGQYWSDDEIDARDHIDGYDSSDTMRKELIGDILHRLQKDGWFVEDNILAHILSVITTLFCFSVILCKNISHLTVHPCLFYRKGMRFVVIIVKSNLRKMVCNILYHGQGQR